MIEDIGEVFSAQKDGAPPTLLASGHAPGESGVAVVHRHYRGGARFHASPRLHVISFVSRSRIHCKLGHRALCHEAHDGSLVICPAGLDTGGDTDQDIESILVAVRPEKFALTAAEHGTLEAHLIGRLGGYDQLLLDAARELVLESKDGYPRGTVFWNETADRFVDTLAASHSVGNEGKPSGLLNKGVLRKLREFIVEHLDEPIDVAMLAKMTNVSQFHFSRAFTRSVGVSPYRYVVHLRLQHAVEMVRDGNVGLAEIAARTGFADQSHLTRWVRRVHGISPTQIRPKREPGRNLQDRLATGTLG